MSAQLASTSNTLFTVALVAYLAAMVAAFFGLAFTRVQVGGVAPSPTTAGRRVGAAALAIAAAGTIAHLTSIVLRGVSAERVPWGNMYEYGSVLAFLAVTTGLVVILRKREFSNLLGFVLLAATVMMATSLLLFADAGPLVPALSSYWIKIHVSGMMVSSSIMIVGFVVTALYLVKDTAERRVAVTSTFGGSTVGAGQVVVRDGVEGRVDGDALEEREATPADQRATLSPVLFPVVPFAIVGLFTLVVWRAPLAAMAAGSVAALLGTAAWYAVPHLPPAARLDALAYRIIAFGFPILTFGIMCGAIWAEESWGRYWGWDPKETGSFVTWVLYACYLHARSTHGWRGRRAAWVGVTAFTALMVTYYAVNLFVVGLHSYAGV